MGTTDREGGGARHAEIPVILLLIAGLVAGCSPALHKQIYAGPQLAPAQIARLSIPYSVLLLKVDGEKVDSTGADYEFLPGSYQLSVMYCDPVMRDYPSDEITVSFEAAAGRRYKLYYEFFSGNEKAWRAWVVDVTTREG